MLANAIICALYLHTWLPLPVTPDVAPILHQQAIIDGILAPDSVSWFDGSTDAHDLQIVREWYIELKGCPHVWAADRFPDSEFIWEGIRFTDGYLDYLNARLANCPHEVWLERAIDDATATRRIWSVAHECKCGYGANYSIRKNLQHLRMLLGLESFDLGFLPPPIPLHHLRELR